MAKKQTKKSRKKKATNFYDISLAAEKEDSQFYPEFSIISKTVDAVNSFDYLYKLWRSGAKGGPSTHEQQDLYRAMLIFACAGLDVCVKQLIKTKLPQLITADKVAEGKFKEYVRSGISKDDKAVLNTVALALIDRNPREIFLSDYIGSMTDGSLQSMKELHKVVEVSGLDAKSILSTEKSNTLKDVFIARNQIIHEMDITVEFDAAKKKSHRTRRQRKYGVVEKHTKAILDFAQELFSAYKKKFEEFKIGTEKGSK